MMNPASRNELFPEPWYRRIAVALGLVAPLWEREVARVWLETGNKVNAIRVVRVNTGCGLLEAIDHFTRITGESGPRVATR